MELSRDFRFEAQQAAEAHLAACQEALWAMEEGGEEIESPAVGPFCGCEICVVREVLFAGWQFLEQGVESERHLHVVRAE